MIIPLYFAFPSGKILGSDPEALQPPSASGRGSVGGSLPNTLVHLGLQAVIAKPFTSPGGLRWVALGAVVPDLPWILQRVLRELPGIDLIALRSYCVVQSTLLLSLVLCAGLAFLSRRPRHAFALLASASSLHLVLDGLQHKWGNGVLLFAPVSWELSDFGWLWPEHPLNLGMTLVGPVLFWWLCRREPPPRARRPAGSRLVLAICLGLAYALLPFAWRAEVARNDLHAVTTIQTETGRAGQSVQFDRARYRADPKRRAGRGCIFHWSGRRLEVESGGPTESGTVSAKGRFSDGERVVLDEVHRHLPYLRQLASVIGLGFVVWVWLPVFSGSGLSGRRRKE